MSNRSWVGSILMPNSFACTLVLSTLDQDHEQWNSSCKFLLNSFTCFLVALSRIVKSIRLVWLVTQQKWRSHVLIINLWRPLGPKMWLTFALQSNMSTKPHYTYIIFTKLCYASLHLVVNVKSVCTAIEDGFFEHLPNNHGQCFSN